MTNQNTKKIIKYYEPTYKITGQDQDYTYIQKETKYSFAPRICNFHNLKMLLFIFNSMCPKKYRTNEAHQVFLDKDNLILIYKCWTDDDRTGEPFIINIIHPRLQRQLYNIILLSQNFTDEQRDILFKTIQQIYYVNICIVCDIECKKKCLCGMVYYCCEEHQKQDRKNHKYICQAGKV